MRLRGSDGDKAERLKREMRWHEPWRSYPRASPAEANRLPVRHAELWKKKIKRLPAGVRRIRQTRKVCLKEEAKFRRDEKRGKRSFLDKNKASSQILASVHLVLCWFKDTKSSKTCCKFPTRLPYNFSSVR